MHDRHIIIYSYHCICTSTLHRFCLCAATPQVLVGKHIEFLWSPAAVLVRPISVFITHPAHLNAEHPNERSVWCSIFCLDFSPGQAHQNRHKGLRGQDTRVRHIHSNSHEIWLDSVVSQQFLPPVIYPMVCSDASLEKAFSGRGIPHSVLPLWQILCWRKLLVEEKSLIQSKPTLIQSYINFLWQILSLIIHVLLAVLGPARAWISSVWQRKLTSHPILTATFPPVVWSDREPGNGISVDRALRLQACMLLHLEINYYR